jgi:hypothetical protein
MNEFLFKPLFINNTTFTPSIVNVSGNGRTDALPHDPKARVLGRPSGHAGVFSDSEGLEQLAEGLIVNGYLNQEHLDRMSEKLFSSKGSLGGYVKHPEGLRGTYTPSELSSRSWAFQGWTGQIAVFDPANAIHHNILLNAIYFKDEWSLQFKHELTKNLSFYNYGNEEKKVETMNQIEYFNYYEDKKVQAIQLDYEDDYMSALIILPSEGTDINNYINSISNSNDEFKTIIDGLKFAKVNLKLPKFE